MTGGTIALLSIEAAALLTLLLPGKGKDMERNRYTLSAFKHDEETGRPMPMHIHGTHHLYTEAEHYAKVMLDANQEATLIEIFDHDTHNIVRRVTRLN
jgi:hypothetical protein